MTESTLKVMIVEDSKVVQKLLVEILSSDENISIISVVGSGEEAIEEIQKNKPDVITLDFSLPKMDGLELTKYIMKECPIPIVVVSGVAESQNVQKSFELLQAGALATIKKPVGLEHQEYQSIKHQLISMVKTMSEVKLVKRRDLKELANLVNNEGEKAKTDSQNHSTDIIAIGASTGGPTAIQKILTQLPKDFPTPIVIVQHIADGFVDGFVSWLSSTTNFNVVVAQNGQSLKSATAYVCPSGFQTGFSNKLSFDISKTEYINGVRPSVSYLFSSVANKFENRAIGIILSGMGKDGALELKEIKTKGGITIAQNKETSTVHGMPGEAIELGSADYVLSTKKIPELLKSLVL